ncbi:MAG: hypothetical protein GW760_02770 [Legionella sp.]|nr:hypothetical protein [Legionella sp.]
MKKISTRTYLKLMATIKENCQTYLAVYDDAFSLMHKISPDDAFDDYFVGTGIDLEEDIILDSETMRTAKQRLEHQYNIASHAVRDCIAQIHSLTISEKQEIFKLIYELMYTFCTSSPSEEKLPPFIHTLTLAIQERFPTEVTPAPEPVIAHQARSMFPPEKRYKQDTTNAEIEPDKPIRVN